MHLIIPIASTAVDWQKLLSLSSQLLQRSLSTPLDAKGIRIGNLGSFVSALGLFHTSSSDPIQVQRAPGSLLKHQMVTFLVGCDRELMLEIMSHGRVSMLDCEAPKLFILSASLEDWQTTIINFAKPELTAELRIFAASLIKEFDTLGLTRIFENYSRTYKGGELVLYQKS
jgi:hypothetical protein